MTFAIAMLTTAQEARALSADGSCMVAAAAAAGQTAGSCSANDLSLTAFHINPSDITEPCTVLGDTWTFSGSVQLAARTNFRYDLGFYVSHAGTSALTDPVCTIAILDNTDLDDNGVSVNLDGDVCGDFTKNTNSVPVGPITAVCTDNDGNGKYDLQVCTSYDNNTGSTCNGIADAVPGAPSKCQCQLINTDFPNCTSNADCVDDGNPCTTELCTVATGTCSHPFATAGTVCRASTGVCDAAETCTGSSATCPADSLATTATICRAAVGVCDAAERCTGSSATCPADSAANSGTVCRAASGVCDVAETCDGSSSTCPTDGFATGTTCRASGGICDVAETCSGSSASCPANTFQTGTTCRASNGICDTAETCSGSSATCPADAFQTGTTCRAAAGVCDVAETCSGASASCPADSFSTSVCRASAGICDVAESCSGASASCPADSFATGTTCRGSAGVCDTAETCDGASASCPADSFQTGTTCRASGGICDVAETCSGASASCPADSFQTGTTCRAASGVCDVAETCSGASASCPADSFATGTICRAGSGTCDPSESCTGASASCPADSFAPSTTACDDGAFCNGGDHCSGSGSCSVHAGDPCAGGVGQCAGTCNETTDTCDGGDGAVCDDGLYCNGTDTCSGGTCSQHSGDPCAGGADCQNTCNETTDTCLTPIGTVCLTDNNVCTDDTCDGTGTCLHTANSAPCDDGLYCDGTDTCAASACTVHTGDPCAGGPLCAQTCNEATDTCFDPITTACTDDGNGCTDDFCDGAGACAHNANSAPCDDGVFCNGDDTCSATTCSVHSGDPCSSGGTGLCANTCNETDNTCFSSDGAPCSDECTTGVCTSGVCVGTSTVLAPSCRWIVLGGVGPALNGATTKLTGVRNDGASSLDGSVCGFYSKRTRGITLGDFVVTAAAGQGKKGVGIRTGPGSDVEGNIVTGGSQVKATRPTKIPGTELILIDGGNSVPKLDDNLVPTGTFVDTTGSHPQVTVCDGDQDLLADAIPILDGLPASESFAKVKIKAHQNQQYTASGLTVIDFVSLRMAGRSTLTLNGGPDDVVILRAAGDIKISYGSQIVLNGVTPQHVLFYGKGRRCKTGRRVTGAGTWFCPVARRFIMGYGTMWEGTILGGSKDIKVRRHSEITHKAFNGL